MTNVIKIKKQTGSAHVIIVAAISLIIVAALGYVYWSNFIREVPTHHTSQPKKDTAIDTEESQEEEYASLQLNFSTLYPKGWEKVQEGSGPGYIQNFNPKTNSTNGEGYPQYYTYVKISRLKQNEEAFKGTSASEWYAKLGTSEVASLSASTTYNPADVSNIHINALSAKSTKTTATDTTEDIFILKDDGYVYRISLYPYGISQNGTVATILDNFKFIDGRQIMIDAIRD